MQPFLKRLDPANDDGFPLERPAKELDARLKEVSDAFRANPARVGEATKGLLDPTFRGARLLPAEDGSENGRAAHCEACRHNRTVPQLSQR